MPHPVDPATHATHDLELVAAYAAGDATSPDLETATALVGGCAGCSALHHDLRLIAAALPAMPAPVRPRDFRLTPEQAASLRPGGWRGLVGAFAGPRFSFAAPLGTGLATLGLAGLLIGTLAGTPLGAGGTRTAASGTGSDNGFSALPPELGEAVGSPKAQVSAQGAESPGPAATGAPVDAFQPVLQPSPGVQPLSRDTEVSPAPVPPPMVLASAVAFLIGAALVTARIAGRRVARAP